MKAGISFVLVATLVTAGVATLGLMVNRTAGAETHQAVVWACLASLGGSVVAAIPLFGPAETGPAGASRFLASMMIRLGLAGLAALAVVVLEPVPASPFLLWLGVAYLSLLIVDTVFALRVFRSL